MKLFIGCSSKEDINEIYFNDCTKLINEIVKIPDIELVYGACDRGLMGVASNKFLEAGKKVTGVVTSYHKELFGDSGSYDTEIVTKTTTERFEKIYEVSDVLLFLPGGLGTYAEVFSAIEEKRIKNGKKIILYNDNYFYTPIIKELYNLHKEGFIDEVPSDYMVIESDIDKIINLIKEEMN